MLMVKLGRDDCVAYVNIDKIIHMFNEWPVDGSNESLPVETRIILGGLDSRTYIVVQGSPDEVQAQVNDALKVAHIEAMTP